MSLKAIIVDDERLARAELKKLLQVYLSRLRYKIKTAMITMKAIRIHEFGGPDVLELEETQIPQPNNCLNC